jgi:hypothetical protein
MVGGWFKRRGERKTGRYPINADENFRKRLQYMVHDKGWVVCRGQGDAALLLCSGARVPFGKA